jgi:5-hydroxyisourate hydrolase
MNHPKQRSPITTHVLDLCQGRPAGGLGVLLEKLSGGNQWSKLGSSLTCSDGRVENLLAPGSRPEPGTYRLSFETGAYFRGTQREGFYPYVSITFEIKNPEDHYHVPLLLSPYGFSTYRGS